MPAKKATGNSPKKATKAKAKSLIITIPKTEGDPKKLTKKLVTEGAPLASKVTLRHSKSSLAAKSFKGDKDKTYLAQPKKQLTIDKSLEKSELEKVIDEIESRGSSSESSSESEDLEEEREEMEPAFALPIAQDQKLLDFELEYIEKSSSGEEMDTEKQEQAEGEIKFLDVFGQMPDVDEISLDLLEEKEEKEGKQEKKPLPTTPGTYIDLGTFLDPITGLSTIKVVSSVKSLSVEMLSDEEAKDHKKKDSEKQGEKRPSELREDTSKDSIKSVDAFGDDTAQVPDNTFDLFLESVRPDDLEVDEEDEEEKRMILLEQQKKIATEKEVMEFLDKLINDCTTKTELYLKNTILLRSLDKYKLICELRDTHNLLQIQKSISRFLNRKTVLFFKRKRTYRPITADLPKVLEANRAHFLTSLKVLDEWLNREKETNLFTADQICTLRQQLEEKKQEYSENANKLEDLISTTFQRKNFDKLKTVVERSLRKMSVIRNEISQVRFKLLLEQHQISSEKKKLAHLEDLGGGLNVRQYESLQTETLATSKKIEENNNTLQRLQRDFEKDLHKLSHAKEKICIVRNIIVTQKQFFAEAVAKERQLRKNIHQLKVQRNHLKYERNNLMHQAGLLSNQILLKDFDRLVEKADNLRQTNEDMKKYIKELTSKIDQLS